MYEGGVFGSGPTGRAVREQGMRAWYGIAYTPSRGYAQTFGTVSAYSPVTHLDVSATTLAEQYSFVQRHRLGRLSGHAEIHIGIGFYVWVPLLVYVIYNADPIGTVGRRVGNLWPHEGLCTFVGHEAARIGFRLRAPWRSWPADFN